MLTLMTKRCSVKDFTLGCLERVGDLQITREHGAYCVRGFDAHGKHVNECRRTSTLARGVASAAKQGKAIPTTGFYPIAPTSLRGAAEVPKRVLDEANRLRTMRVKARAAGGSRADFERAAREVAEELVAELRAQGYAVGVRTGGPGWGGFRSIIVAEEEAPANLQGGGRRRAPKPPWERGEGIAATVEKSRKRFEAQLIEAGCTRTSKGWHQDGVFLSKDPKEALRLLYGGG